LGKLRKVQSIDSETKGGEYMSETNRSRVDRILQKLQQARQRKLSCFGSDRHGFRLNNPLSEVEIQAFETSHNIRLPDDYRTFLAYAGNGGAGPYYGIFPLDKWDDFADWVIDEKPDNFLSLSCPLHSKMNLAEDWEELLAKDEATPYRGTLSLGSQGCTYAMQLIVSGTAIGQVVYVDADGQVPYIVREPDFLAWYERWLDELLQGYKTDWFGYGISGDEDRFLSILNDLQADDDLKSEAANAFCRLPRLSDVAARKIPEYLDSPIVGVRAGILATIHNFKLGGIESVARLLDDPHPDVRRAAICAFMTSKSKNWINEILNRLHKEPDESVATTAFFQLKEAGAFSKPELLRILNQSPFGSLRQSAAYEIKWSNEDLPLLIHLLSDSHTQVRFYATLGLQQLKTRDCIPQVLELLSREKEWHVVRIILIMLGEFGDRSTVPVLLEWAENEDDFHRLDAMEALAKIGDDRAITIARAMLQEHRSPQRSNSDGGFGGMSSIHTIATLVRKSLKESPNVHLRNLVGH
jgi:HEAT repeat protein